MESKQEQDAGMTSAQPITVGVSANVLHPALAGIPRDGIGVYTAALERSLPACGVRVQRVFAPAVRARAWLRVPPGELGFREPLPAAILRSGVAPWPIAGAKKVTTAIDLYHATDYLVPPLRGTPIVVTLYDAIPHAHPEWATARLRPLKNWIRQRGIERADLVLALSHATVPELEEHYRVPRERIRVVHLGVDAIWFESVPAEDVASVLARRALHAGYLIFVGTLQPRKNVRGLLAAYDALPAAVRAERQLVIVGRFGWGDASLRDELGRRTAAGRCVWLQDVGGAELRALYGAAAALVFPSLSEGFGLPVLEALASGVPVVASDLPVLHEVAGGQAIYVHPRDPGSLAAGIQEALGAGRERVSVQRRREHARHFSWEATARATAAAYRELL